MGKKSSKAEKPCDEMESEPIQDVIEEIREVEKEEGAKGVEKYLRRKLNAWREVPLNVAVIGTTGAEKLTFIDTIRGLTPHDPGAAQIESANNNSHAFSHPSNRNLVFWDLSVDLSDSEAETSFVDFELYDFFIFLSSTRFSDAELHLAHVLNAQDKECCLVRTVLVTEMENKERFNAHSISPIKPLDLLRQELRAAMKNFYVTDHVFIIDCHRRTYYDFDSLELRIVKGFPKTKQEALILSLQPFSLAILEEKIKVLKSRIWMFAMLSAGVAAVPVPGLSLGADIATIVACASQYFSQLGMENEAIDQMASVHGSDAETLRLIVSSKVSSSDFLTAQGIRSLLAGMTVFGVASATEEAVRFIPLVGIFLSAPLSGGAMYYVLSQILDRFSKVAIELVDSSVQQNSIHDISQ